MNPSNLERWLSIGTLLIPVVSFASSLLLAFLRAYDPRPADQLPAWLRGLEAVLDRLAVNSERRKA